MPNPAFVNSAAATSAAASSLVVTYAGTQGNVLIAGVLVNGTGVTVSTIVDNNGKQFVKSSFQSAQGHRVEVWWLNMSAAGVTSYTVNWGSLTPGTITVFTGEYSGFGSDGNTGANANASNAVATVTTMVTDKNSFVVGFFAASGSTTVTQNIGTLRQTALSGTMQCAMVDNTTATVGHSSVVCNVTLGVAEQWTSISFEIRGWSWASTDNNLEHVLAAQAPIFFFPVSDEESVQLLPLAPVVPTTPWDTDADGQQLQAAGMRDDVLDSGVELIQYSPGVLTGWDAQDERQQAQPVSVRDDDGQWTNYIVLAPFVPAQPWDTDSEQQQAQAASARDDDESRQTIGVLLIPPFAWTNDLDQLTRTAQQIIADNSEDRDWPNLVIIAPTVPTTAWDSDSDQQQAAAGQVRDDRPEWTNFIVLPPFIPKTPFDADGEQQRPWAPQPQDSEELRNWINFIITSIPRNVLAALNARGVPQLVMFSKGVLVVGRTVPQLAETSGRVVPKLISLGGRVIY